MKSIYLAFKSLLHEEAQSLSISSNNLQYLAQIPFLHQYEVIKKT
jgi:hypothetical protein